MWWKTKRPAEHLPWYRDPSYKGTMTEAEKRELDSFRLREPHPSAEYDELPDEVQSYLSSIEVDLYNLKQQTIIMRTVLFSGFGALMLYISYFGIRPMDDLITRLSSVMLIILPWFFYRRDWRKNSEEFLPRDPSSPHTVDERIKYFWELNYVVEKAGRARSKND